VHALACRRTQLQTCQIIRNDVSPTHVRGQPIVSKEWLAEIIFAAAGRHGGLYALSVVAALVIATTFALLHAQMVREGNDILVATVLVLLASFAASTHWLARPHVFSFPDDCGVARRAATLWSATAIRGGWRSRSVADVLWVNLHGGYLAGLLVLSRVLVRRVAGAESQQARQLTVVALVCARCPC